MLDMQELAEILVQKLSDAQIDAILQEISARYERGCCPICGEQDMPFDKQGKRIDGPDMSNAEWHEIHEIDCIVTLIEEMRELRKGHNK